MTDEIINQGIKLRDKIKEIDDVLYSITPYLHNDIEITIQKKVLNYNNGEKGYNATVKQLGKTIFNTIPGKPAPDPISKIY